MNMDIDVCREHLAGLLTQEVSLLRELEGLLTEEHAVLTANPKDVDTLNKTTRERLERVGALARIEEQRRSLCTMHGHSADFAGLERLLVWCDPSGTLMARLRDCATHAGRCRDLNDRNGVLVTARLKHVGGLLDTLTGRPDRADPYGPRGYADTARPGRVLGAA
jgi:flagellar biosynthesis/type III secretory pathway chaperone